MAATATVADDTDTIRFLQTAIDALSRPPTLGSSTPFEIDMAKLAETAVKTDQDLVRLKKEMLAVVGQHQQDLPELSFQCDQFGYNQRNYNSLLRISRDFASQMSKIYGYYDEKLQIVQDVKTKEDVQHAATSLQQLVKDRKVQVPSEFAQWYLDLRRATKEFRDKLDRYLAGKGIVVSAAAAGLQKIIWEILSQVDGLNTRITGTTSKYTISSWWLLTGAVVSGTDLGTLCGDRDGKEQELYKQRSDLDEVNKDQLDVPHLKSGLEGLNGVLEIMCSSLNVFADMWVQFHNEAIQFSSILSKLPDIEFPLEFKLRVELARKTVAPLQAALNKYASILDEYLDNC